MIPARLTPAIMARLLLGLMVLVSVAPLLLVLINAFKPHGDIVLNPLSLPGSLAPTNFKAAWIGGNFSVGLVNSMLLTGTTVLVTVICGSLAAFPLARRRIAIWKLVTIYFLCSVTVPIQLFLFPLYFVYARLGLIGNVFATALIIAAINLPLSVMLLRTYILAIPVELDDAAFIDGATPWQTFRYVILPLMKPGCVTVAVIVALSHYVSLGSVLAAAAFPLILAWLEHDSFPPAALLISAAAAFLVIFRHRQNIGRLCAGTESRFGARKA